MLFTDSRNDIDILQCYEDAFVIEDIKKADKNNYSLLIVTEYSSSPLHVKLQLVYNGIPLTRVFWDYLYHRLKTDIYKIDRSERIVFCDFPGYYNICNDSYMFSRSKHKPAAKHSSGKIDFVSSYICKTWPSIANEWLDRNRYYEWPTKDMVFKLKSFGVFLIKKGHPFSPEKDLEWKISFTLQERELMFSLTDVQYKCYVVLKLLNQDIIKLDYISSYHWKTCLFYTIEENSKHVWKKEHIFYCVRLCIQKMFIWVKDGFCPSYFIPRDNLFNGKLNNGLSKMSEKILGELLNFGLNSLSNVKSDNICNFVKSRRSVQHFNSLQKQSKKVAKKVLIEMHLTQMIMTCFVFNDHITELYYVRAKKNILIFIQYVWLTLNDIQQIDSITKHTTEETKSSLSLLTPHIYTCLASNISAMAIQQPILKVRGFLLFGAYTYFMKGGLSGYLKFVSVLFTLGMYKESEWYLDQLNEECIKSNTFCLCGYANNDVMTTVNNINNTSQFNVSPCIWFLPSEAPITLDAMQYEIFRHFDTCLHKNENEKIFCLVNARAVVDSSVYFYLLKLLLKRRQSILLDFVDFYNIFHLRNIKHEVVAFNVLAWCLQTYEQTKMVLQFSSISSRRTNSQYRFISKHKSKHCLSNAATIHALVCLYNTWFAINPSCTRFCVQCFNSITDLKKCSRCKITAYCSKQCQKNNWTIHKRVCIIVSRHSN